MAAIELMQPQVRDHVVAHLRAGTNVEIIGLPGSGRSTLLDAAARALDEDGWEIVRLLGVHALAGKPLEVLAIAGLVPRLEARSSSAVSVATAELQAALSGPRPLLVIDDVDALDETSAGVIAAAYAQRLFPVLSAARPRRRAHVVPGTDLQPAIRLVVHPLRFDVFQDLIADELPGPVAAGLAGRLFTLSGGLPSLALSVLGLARQHDRVRQIDGVWRLVSELFSAELAPTVERFLDGLGDEARTAIETLAVTGTIRLDTARGLASTESLAELEAAGLLRFASRGQDVVLGVFPHAVAEHLRQNVPRIRRIELGERLGERSDPDRRAGVDRPLPVGFPVPSSLEDPFQVDDGPDEASTILNRMFITEWYGATLERRTAWEHDPSPRTGLPYLRTLIVGDADPQALHDVLDRTGPDDDPVWTVSWTIRRADVAAEIDHDLPGARAILAAASPDAGDLVGWLEAEDRRLRILHGVVPTTAQGLPDVALPDVARQTIRRVEAHRLLALGDAAGALASADAAMVGEDGEQARWGRVLHGIALVADGRHDEALRTSLVELERGWVELDPDSIHGHGYVVSLALLLASRTDELRSHLATMLSIGLRSSLHRQFEAGTRSIGAAVAALDGRPETARSLAQQAGSIPDALGPFPLTTPTWALGLLDSREHGDSPESRRRAADALWEEALILFGRGSALAGAVAGALAVDFAPDVGRLDHLRSERPGESSALVRDLLLLAQASGAPVHEALTTGRSLIARGQVLLGSRALAHAAGRIQETGDGEAVRAVLVEARDLVRQHGGDPAGVVRPMDGAGALTPREAQIAELVVAGRSNEEIARRLHLSLRTVQNNLGRVFAKLGVAGRAELTREALGG